MSAGPVAVIGAGTMGHGIAYAVALAGLDVHLTDSRAEALPQALERVHQLLDGAVARGKLTAAERERVRGRLHATPELARPVRDAVVVIQAVVGDLAVNPRLFAAPDRPAPAPAPLPTHPSSPPV